MFCKNCGAVINDGQKFCTSCGASNNAGGSSAGSYGGSGAATPFGGASQGYTPASHTGRGSSNSSSSQGYGGSNSYTPPQNYGGSNSYTPPQNYGGSNSYTPPQNYGGSNSYTPPQNYGGSNSYTPPQNYGGSNSYTPPQNYSGSNSYTPPQNYSGSNDYSQPQNYSGMAPYGGESSYQPGTIAPYPGEDNNGGANPVRRSNGNKCPHCGGDVVPIMTTTQGKSYSAGSGCLGYLLLGPFGLLCGLCGTKGATQKTEWICQKCGAKVRVAGAVRNELEETKKTSTRYIVIGAVGLVFALILLIIALSADAEALVGFAVAGIVILIVDIIIFALVRIFGVKKLEEELSKFQ